MGDGYERSIGRAGRIPRSGRSVSAKARAQLARGLIYSRAAMRSEGFDLLLRHISDGGRGRELWRTVPRLLRFGEPGRAMRLAAALAGV